MSEIVELIGYDPLQHQLWLEEFIVFVGQDQDAVIQLKCFLRDALTFVMKVKVASDDDVSEEDDIGNPHI